MMSDPENPIDGPQDEPTPEMADGDSQGDAAVQPEPGADESDQGIDSAAVAAYGTAAGLVGAEISSQPMSVAPEEAPALGDASEVTQDETGELERPGGLLSKVDGHLVMYHDPSGLLAEQYRACRTNLSALNPSGAPWAIVVTSSKRGEGKSITAANLAACMAEVPGTRVCLLDLDSRAPGIGNAFGIEMERGVTELIKGEVSLNHVRIPSVVPNLDLVCAGAEPDSPAELLGSDSFVHLMDELKRRYTWIILDAPPVNPWTDACVVSALVNGALLVVRLQDTARNTVNRSIENIRAAGGRVIGSFLTGLASDPLDAAHYGYGYDRDEGYDWSGSGPRTEETLGKDRARAEKRLRKQERALLKHQNKLRKREHNKDTPV